jgi:hypothetical protein
MSLEICLKKKREFIYSWNLACLAHLLTAHALASPPESAFAPYVGFGVVMTPNLGTNVFYLRFATNTSLMKVSKV